MKTSCTPCKDNEWSSGNCDMCNSCHGLGNCKLPRTSISIDFQVHSELYRSQRQSLGFSSKRILIEWLSAGFFSHLAVTVNPVRF